jgi:hypothetical protein
VSALLVIVAIFAWGLWLFTGCILASLAVSTLTERRLAA